MNQSSRYLPCSLLYQDTKRPTNHVSKSNASNQAKLMLDIDKNLLSGYFNLTEKLMHK